MKLYSENNDYKLYQGNMLDMLEVIESNSIDSIVTDPPYELNFMSKNWDNSGIAFQSDTWKRCYEVLKPGGYLLAFGGSRTFHRIACAIEDAGFEIRDTIMWIYGSGFPKSMNIGNKLKEWQGWGTCLKPSFEPIIVARKPFKGSLVDNVIEYGVGGINIDECRVCLNGEKVPKGSGNICNSGIEQKWGFKGNGGNETSSLGRFPANTILTYDETDFDEVCGGFPNTQGSKPHARGGTNFGIGIESDNRKNDMLSGFNDSGSASRYFYCAKASKRDRDEGLNVETEEYMLKEDTPKEMEQLILNSLTS